MCIKSNCFFYPIQCIQACNFYFFWQWCSGTSLLESCTSTKAPSFTGDFLTSVLYGLLDLNWERLDQFTAHRRDHSWNQGVCYDYPVHRGQESSWFPGSMVLDPTVLRRYFCLWMDVKLFFLWVGIWSVMFYSTMLLYHFREILNSGF